MDLGSAAIKIAVVEDERLLCGKRVPAAPGQEVRAQSLINEALQELGYTKS